MLAVERRERLIDIIHSEGSVSVDAMAAEFGVTPMTIRRDLKQLSQDGNIARCHGGAVLKTETDYSEKKITNHSAKFKIAEKAKEFIPRDSVVFLDAGTTTYEMATQLEAMPNLTIITNDINIAVKLSATHDNVIICGGQVQRKTGCVAGYYASRMMEDFTFDVGFFGSASVDSNFNAACPTIEKAFLKKQLVEQCVKSYLLVDASKFHKNGMNRINRLNEYTGVITDCEFTQGEKERISKLNINMYYV